MLSLIGHQLLSLAVYVWDTLYVDRVFQMCPKLQKFYITDLPETFVGLNEPIKVQKHLVEFGFAEKDYDSQSLHFPPEHLLQILRALPNLRVWLINKCLFDQRECKLICEALEQNLILQKLELFHLISDAAICMNVELKASCMEAANRVMRTLIDHCPKLSLVRVERDND